MDRVQKEILELNDPTDEGQILKHDPILLGIEKNTIDARRETP
jgi:hypothetical protein